MFRLRNSMISRELEFLYIRFTKKEQPFRFALGIQGLPGSLNSFISDLQGRNKLCVSLLEFQDFQGA